MKHTVLCDMLRENTREISNGYLDLTQFTTNDGLRRYICESIWVDRVGLVGKFALVFGDMKKQLEDGNNNKEGGHGSGGKSIGIHYAP